MSTAGHTFHKVLPMQGYWECNHDWIIAQHTDISDAVCFTTHDSFVAEKDTMSCNCKLLLLLVQSSFPVATATAAAISTGSH